MKAYRVTAYFVKEGIRLQKFFLSAVPCYFFVWLAYRASGTADVRTGLADVVEYGFWGNEYISGSLKESLRLPALWLMQMAWMSLSVSGYTEEFTAYGQQAFVRSGSRKLWWVAHCIWNIVSTLLYFLMGFVTLMGLLIWEARGKAYGSLAGLLRYAARNMQGEVLYLVCPIITGGIAWNLFQMYVAVCTNYMIGFLLTCCMLLASIYIYSPFLVGNYLMLARNGRAAGGLDMKMGYLLFFILALWAVIGGSIRTAGKDYLLKE